MNNSDIPVNNFHRVLRNEPEGFFTQLLPTRTQLDTFKECKDLIQEALEVILKEVYDVKPKFRLQGSWAYGTCNVPNRIGQEMDFDYGCYLPERCFPDEQKNEAEKLINHVKQCLSQLCFDQNWELDDKNPSCLRIRGFMVDAHFDIPLYAVPNDMFNDLKDVPISSRKNSDVVEANESYDDLSSRNYRNALNFSEDTQPQALSEFFGESSFNRSSGITTFGESVESRQFDGVQKNESAQPPIKDISLIRNDGEWKQSNCERVREWFLGVCKGQAGEGQQLRSIIRYIKAWRDYNFDPNERKQPISLALMILTVDSYEHCQQRDDKALAKVVSELPNRFLKDITCPNIKDHEEEVFNDYNGDKNKYRRQDSELAQEFSDTLNYCLTEATEARKCLYALKVCLGDKIPSNEDLVSIHNEISQGAINAKNKPVQVATAPAIIPSQTGG
ncbi:CBASS cGAMP synthase [Psychrobacter faecalis]|uniref:CBASS cGAMP synthase n=1 Tax=Psychrobacter TaxID=497 RepID=UPI000C2A41C5|nr:hypothetical protein [Psychrobacter sp. L7]PJX24815.1 hypothetical protein CAP50_04405 [Psychrobacter sp. L7]